MRFETHVMKAIRFRACATGERFMRIAHVFADLGGPADFEDVLEKLQARRAIILHPWSDCLTLTLEGAKARAP